MMIRAARFVSFTVMLLAIVTVGPSRQGRGAAPEPAAARSTKTVRLLTVGNSFSRNATRYLEDLAKADGNRLVHHQAFIGGSAMQVHWEKVEKFEQDPKDKQGFYSTGLSLKQELLAEPWDFVTIQQASIRSHDLATYQPYAGRLYDYIHKYSPDAEILLHETWAYRRDDPRFAVQTPAAGEPATQEAMYRSLANAYQTIAAELGVRQISTGDAFHLADNDSKRGYQVDAEFDFAEARSAAQPTLPDQTNSLHVGWRWTKGKDGKPALQMDGHHANAAGEYLGGCVFYEVLFERSVVGNSFVPQGLDPAYARFLQETAHQAVANTRAKELKAARSVSATKPEEVAGKSYDLVVVGGTAGGVACAVRAAREGCSVLLVNHTQHLGGMMTNGLMQWDALYGGHRAPLFSELLGNIERYYRTKYGEDSGDYRTARFTQEHYPMGWAEPHIAEREFNRLLAGEKNIAVLLGHYPTAVERDGAIVRSVTLCEYGGSKQINVRGEMFADATYEGDLFALAKVPYRVGREAKDEFHEPHAGKIFTNIQGKTASPQAAVEGKLNIHPYSSRQGSIDPTSPFSADGAIQAFNYRFCVTKDPDNRILPEKPAGYNRDEFVHYERKSIATNAGPNLKSHMNSPILPGENHAYPEADWPTREKITARHRDFALGLMWFLQNDESVSAAKRKAYREWGLPKDEFADHDHIPYEMYVRETRRIVGRHVYSERDNSLATGLERTPIHADSVAITDWYMDSHSCTTDSRPKFHYDGKLILTEESRPGQIPYRALLPQGVDNLLVPVCMSATHVAWGAVRLEPVWMETGEAAGFAAALAHQHKTTPAKLDPELLVRTLATRRMLVSFFNDVDAGADASWIPALQYFGTHGFFASYDARPNDGLKLATAKVWADGLAKLRGGNVDANALARAVAEAERSEGTITAIEFAVLLPSSTQPQTALRGTDITRHEAIEIMWKLLAQP